MFDFKKEVNKFRPMTEVGDIENSILNNEVQDIMDLLRIAENNEPKSDKKKNKKE